MAGSVGHRQIVSRDSRGITIYTSTVDTAALISLAQYWAYRAGGYALLNLVDDPAWLALIFC